MQQQLLGLDIGSATAKFVVLSSKGRGSRPPVYITNSGTVEIPPGSVVAGEIVQPVAVASAVKSALQTRGIMVRRVAVAVNGSHLVLRRLDLPPLPVVQLKQLLRWEIGRYVPYPAQETEFGFVSLERTPQQHTVLLAASTKNIVQTLMETVRLAGLRPLLLEPGMVALLRWVQYCHPTQTDNLILLDFGTSTADILIVNHGQPVIARTVTIKADQGRAKEGLLAEIRRSIDFARTQDHVDPSPHCFCVGGRANDNLFLRDIKNHLGVQVSQIENCLSSTIDLNLFATALGLGLGWWSGGVLCSQFQS
mgnify:CR=1 FL=1